jgi:putative glycosyltransferase epsF
MSAMDVFLMPSQWEGLPVVLVEAQANGLPCIISDVITEQVDVCCIRRLSLYDNVCKWADEVMLTTRIKKECSELLDTFDIRHVAKSLENFYLNEGGL